MSSPQIPRRTTFERLTSLPTECLVLAVRGYQLLISPFIGRVCRFQPSCSQYMIGALRKYGLIRGTLKGLARIGRCHPWHPGGHDPP